MNTNYRNLLTGSRTWVWFGTLILIASLIYLFAQFGQLVVSAQGPVCTQPTDVATAFTFCDAAHDDLADEFAAPLRNVKTNGYIPPIVLKAIGGWETRGSGGWIQCVNQEPISDGCAWGIMQIQTGMNCVPAGDQFNTETQTAIKYNYRYNIATGADLLHEKWDWHKQNGRTIGNGIPEIAEHWYYAVWAYNSWIARNSPDHPQNPCSNWPISAENCAYQDQVWWMAAHPPARGGQPLWSATNVNFRA